MHVSRSWTALFAFVFACFGLDSLALIEGVYTPQWPGDFLVWSASFSLDSAAAFAPIGGYLTLSRWKHCTIEDEPMTCSHNHIWTLVYGNH